jgi:hypothetical protein
MAQDRSAFHNLARCRFFIGGRLQNNLHFVLEIRITDFDVEHEPVELRFGKRIGAFLFDGVLGRQDKKRQVQRKSCAAGSDFVFLH